MEEKLRVWWVPQVPGKPFYVPVQNPEEAALILSTLAEYDEFQLQENIKPDYTNAGGLEYRNSHGDGGEWYSEDGDDIWEWLEHGREGDT